MIGLSLGGAEGDSRAYQLQGTPYEAVAQPAPLPELGRTNGVTL